MAETLTVTEAKWLAAFLNDLSEHQGNAGCNDLFMPDTSENREILTAALNFDSDFEEDKEIHTCSVGKGENKRTVLSTSDFIIVEYLKHKLMKMYNLTNKDIPKTGS